MTPEPEWIRYEHRALVHWDGRGAARPVAFDAPRGALLEERLLPGQTLAASGLDDSAATQVFVDVAAALRGAGRGQADLPHVSTWLSRLDEPPRGPAPAELPRHAAAASALGRALLGSAGDE